MRKVLGLVSLFALAAAAGTPARAAGEAPLPFQQDEAGRVFFETIHEVAGVAGGDLFTRAESWISKHFKEEDVDQRVADSNRGWLTFRTLTVTPKGWHGLDTSGDGYLRYEIQLAFKDGRTRFRAADFHFLLAETWSGDGEMRVDVTDKELFLTDNKKRQKARTELAAQLASLSESLGRALTAGAESDW